MPNFEDLKTSRTSARPSSTSSYSGRHALEGRLDLVDRLVDHRVVADLDALAVGQLGGLALGTDVEAHDDDVVRDGEVDVALGDAADAAVDDPQLDLLTHVQLHQGFLERLDGARVVTLDDQVEGVGLLQRGVQVLQADALATARQLGVALAGTAPVGDLAGHPVLVHDEERVARTRHRRQTDDLHRARRERLGDVLAVLVDHAPDAPGGVAGHDRVADPERSALDQHRGHRAATAVR